MRKSDVVILDCYTDEPSGYGVRPFLGTHQIHLSQALAYAGIDHYYLTIDDLRFSMRGDLGDSNNTDLSVYNRTKNCYDAISILHRAKIIYIIMGCFVDYKYFSSVPPKSDEVYEYLKDTKAKKVLFYVLGTADGIAPDYKNLPLSSIIDHVEFGNTYRFILEDGTKYNLLEPNYELLDKISGYEVPIIPQLRYPIIGEIETGAGCNTATCVFCIEHVRPIRPIYRKPESIIKQIKSLYDSGVRHFRLGKQPNFYHYYYQNVYQMEKLLYGIREVCPDIETLHIDNANIINVVTEKGEQISQLIARYCTSGNIAPFGIESFDPKVRKAIHKPGSAQQAIRAIEIINKYGQIRGEDGFPRFLPGINLIYGLPAQTNETHQINLAYLQQILEKGLQTRRLFFRKMTRPTGVSFSLDPGTSEEYKKWFQEIVQSFVLPMQTRVFPPGTILKNLREVIWKNGDSYLRPLGTSPIRVVVRGKTLRPYERYTVRVIGNAGYRLLEGELIE